MERMLEGGSSNTQNLRENQNNQISEEKSDSSSSEESHSN
jgi:hypothetical protein